MSSKMSIAELFEQFMISWFSLVEDGEEGDGELDDGFKTVKPTFEGTLYATFVCNDEEDKRLLDDGDIKQLSIFESTLEFTLTSSKLDVVDASSHE